MKNDVYAYPDTWVCLHDTYGCDDYELEEQCLNSSMLTEGGGTRAIFYPDGEYQQEVSAVGRLTTVSRGHVTLDLYVPIPSADFFYLCIVHKFAFRRRVA